MSGAGGGLAGTGPTGSFFEAPGWVDLAKRPGATVQVAPDWASWARGVVRLRHVVFSPNLVWLAIAAAVYVLFPYDLDGAATFRAAWVARRTALNLALMFGYVGFWHAALYVWRWSNRKFVPGSAPGRGRVLHNVWWSTLGTLQWSAWECAFMHLYGSRSQHLSFQPPISLRLALFGLIL